MDLLPEIEIAIESILGPNGKLAQVFPHYEFRPEQITMSKAVAASLVMEKPLLVEAGTGTGKTLAYLIPAVYSSQKIVVSTGTKNLQEQISLKDIPFLHSLLDKKFMVCTMKGRQNYLCQRRWKEFVRRPWLKDKRVHEQTKKIQNWLSQTSFGDRSELDFLSDHDPLWEEVNSKSDLCLGQKCERFKECFITKLRQEACRADLIIVNHHLFFSDLLLKQRTPSEILPRFNGIIFDEAHQLEDIATEYFGVSLSNYQIQELIRDTEKELEAAGLKSGDITSSLQLLNQRAGSFFVQFPFHLDKKRLKSDLLTEAVLEKYHRFLDTLELVSSQIATLKKKPESLHSCERRCRELHSSLSFIMDMKDQEYVYWIESRTKAIYLHASPIEVADDLHRLLFEKMKRTVLTSATLSINNSFDFLKSRLGLSSPEELILKSHFDYKQQAMIYVPIHLPPPQEEQFITQAAEEIMSILNVSEGRAFVLFTSYKNMNEIYELLRGKIPYTLLRQGDRPKSTLLAEFQKDIHSVLLATTSFWEGIDVQGEALSCVIIDRLPFAVPTEPLVEARINYLLENEQNPFLSYQVPHAVITLRQGVGRLIRNRADRGLLCILDRRLLTKPYGRIFLQNLPPCPIIQRLEQSKALWEY